MQPRGFSSPEFKAEVESVFPAGRTNLSWGVIATRLQQERGSGVERLTTAEPRPSTSELRAPRAPGRRAQNLVEQQEAGFPA